MMMTVTVTVCIVTRPVVRTSIERRMCWMVSQSWNSARSRRRPSAVQESVLGQELAGQDTLPRRFVRVFAFEFVLLVSDDDLEDRGLSNGVELFEMSSEWKWEYGSPAQVWKVNLGSEATTSHRQEEECLQTFTHRRQEWGSGERPPLLRVNRSASVGYRMVFGWGFCGLMFAQTLMQRSLHCGVQLARYVDFDCGLIAWLYDSFFYNWALDWYWGQTLNW